MSRFSVWFIASQLKDLGWPKSKGIFRKDYVDARLLDVGVEHAIQACVGLGAGRPQLGVAVLADVFANNPWTKESTAKLLLDLKKEGEHDIESNPDLTPWKALLAKYNMSKMGNEAPWSILGHPTFLGVVTLASAKGLFWGLSHEGDMPGIFAKAKADYERTAAEAIPHGLAVPAQFQWNSLEHFYETCEDLVRAFESAMSGAHQPPLREVPSALRTAQEVARRLRDDAR